MSRLYSHEMSPLAELFLPSHSCTNVYQPQSGGFFASSHTRIRLVAQSSLAVPAVAPQKVTSWGRRCSDARRASGLTTCWMCVSEKQRRSRLHSSCSSACKRNLHLCEKNVFGPCHNSLTRTEKPCLLILLRSHELGSNPVSLDSGFFMRFIMSVCELDVVPQLFSYYQQSFFQ